MHIMKDLVVLCAALGMTCIVACAVGGPSEDGTTNASDPVEQPSSRIQPDITTSRQNIFFPDGCALFFWCHNDNAIGNASGFCIKNNSCSEAAAAQDAHRHCINSCDSGCNVQTSFHACGPG